MSRPARWECELPSCRRLLAEIENGGLRIARAVEVVYAVEAGCCVVCPGCEEPRMWRWEPPVKLGIALSTGLV